MALVPMKSFLVPARSQGFAVPSVDVASLHDAAGVLEAACEKRSPVILAVAEGFGKITPLEALVKGLCYEAERVPVPVAILLDHGSSLEAVIRFINAGCTSVMYDGSELSLEENIRNTREVVRVARAHGVDVEAEVGHVGSGTDYDIIATGKQHYTEPKDAVRFFEETGVDHLAVAVGTAHGHYVGEPKLDFARLEQIRGLIPVPLVLHGGSGTGDENLRRAVQLGICKVNWFTAAATQAAHEMRSALETPRYLESLTAARQAFKANAAHLFDVLLSAGRG